MRILQRIRELRANPPWEEPSQWALAVLLAMLVVFVFLPTNQVLFRRTVQLVVIGLIVLAAIGAGAFEHLGVTFR